MGENILSRLFRLNFPACTREALSFLTSYISQGCPAIPGLNANTEQVIVEICQEFVLFQSVRGPPKVNNRIMILKNTWLVLVSKTSTTDVFITAENHCFGLSFLPWYVLLSFELFTVGWHILILFLFTFFASIYIFQSLDIEITIKINSGF